MVSEFSKLPLSDLQCDWSSTIPIFKISMFCRILVSCPWMLVGWNDVHSLINTDSSIPALTTFPGKVFPQTFLRGLGLGSRLKSGCDQGAAAEGCDWGASSKQAKWASYFVIVNDPVFASINFDKFWKPLLPMGQSSLIPRLSPSFLYGKSREGLV